MRLRKRQSWLLSTYPKQELAVGLSEWTWIRGSRRVGRKVEVLVVSRGEMISGQGMTHKDLEKKSTPTTKTQVEVTTTTEKEETTITEDNEDRAVTGIEATEAKAIENEVKGGMVEETMVGIGETENVEVTGKGITGEEGITTEKTEQTERIEGRGGTIRIIGSNGSRGTAADRLERRQSQWWSRLRRTIDGMRMA